MGRKKLYGKLILDLVLLVLLALIYQKRAISMQFHEWGGIVLCGLFLIHKALNWKWIRGVTAGTFRRKAKVNARWIVDVLVRHCNSRTFRLVSEAIPFKKVYIRHFIETKSIRKSLKKFGFWRI